MSREIELKSLAVKHRPRVFEDLVGQDHIITQLQGMLKAQRFPSTLLITGQTGTGKTTISRMIASYINCLKPDSKTYAPCGECISCKYGDAHPDFMELNLADARGIEDIRGLIASSRNMPSFGKNRIFLLDECFPASTKVLLADSSLATIYDIYRDILLGKKVFVKSYNHKTNEVEDKEVVGGSTSIKPLSDIINVEFSDGSWQNASSNHPWFVPCKDSYVHTTNLENDYLFSFDGLHLRVVNKFNISKDDDTKVCLYDISVLDNHNFFINPCGSENTVLVHNCHQMTPTAAQALLKPLEEPPSRTMWILATTNPEKLPATIVGRCHQFSVKPIEPEVLIKRLMKISKQEGVNFKDLDEGKKILQLIADITNGKMRDSIQMLESVIFAVKSGKKVDTKKVLSEFLLTTEAELDQAAAELLCAVLSGNGKSMIKILRTCTAPRGLLSKLRWLVQFLLDSYAGVAKYTPYSAKLFSQLAKKAEVKPKVQILLKTQYTILEMESKMNTMSIDEQVIMLSMLGNLVLEIKK